MARTRGGVSRSRRSESLRDSTRWARGRKKDLKASTSSDPVRVCSRSPSPAEEQSTNSANVPLIRRSRRTRGAEPETIEAIHTATEARSERGQKPRVPTLQSEGQIGKSPIATVSPKSTKSHHPSTSKRQTDKPSGPIEVAEPRVPTDEGTVAQREQVDVQEEVTDPLDNDESLEVDIEQLVGEKVPSGQISDENGEKNEDTTAPPSKKKPGKRYKMLARKRTHSVESSKRLKTSSKSSTTYSSIFVTEEAENRLEIVRKRNFLSERPLDVESYSKKSDIITILQHLNLMGSVTNINGYVESIIHEFYCNLDAMVFDENSSRFGTVFVRGKFFVFSAAKINEVLGVIVDDVPEEEVNFDHVICELTGGLRSLWPTKKDFPASQLTLKYALLHKIALFNWMPSMHSGGVKKSLALLLFRLGGSIPVNLGQLIFDHLRMYSTTLVNSSSLIFPNLIFKILESQKSTISGKESLVLGGAIMKLTAKSLKKKDIAVPSVDTPLQQAALKLTLRKAISRLENLETDVRSQKVLIDNQLALINATLGDLNAFALAYAHDEDTQPSTS